MSLDEVRDSILNVPGVLSLHELHVWQLSENKLVASVHVLASRDHDFMPVAVKIREAMHHLGIHSCTIQPEYHHPNTSIPEEILKVCTFSSMRSTPSFIYLQRQSSCLILCPADEICSPSENACCRKSFICSSKSYLTICQLLPRTGQQKFSDCIYTLSTDSNYICEHVPFIYPLRP